MNNTTFLRTYILAGILALCTMTVCLILLTSGCAGKNGKPADQDDAEAGQLTYDEYYRQYMEYMTERGKVLVKLGGCSKCHTPKIKTTLGYKPDKEKFLSGYPQDQELPDLPYDEIIYGEAERSFYTTDATIWVGRWGVSFAGNLTPDTETGLGSLTETQFVEIFRSKKRSSGSRELSPPMPMEAYSTFSDIDLRSIYIYLRTIEPISNKVPDRIFPESDAFERDT